MALPGTGTFVNILSITAGTGLGWLVGQRLPLRVTSVVLQVLGPLTIVIGIQMALTAQSAAQSVTVLLSLVLGAILGELINIELWLERLGQQLERWVSNYLGPSPITKAFVTTSILYVVGPMAILGSLRDGVQGDPSLLLIKSALDGIASIAFTTSMGIGVIFSVLPVLIYQGSLTLLSQLLGQALNPDAITAITATGGILVMCVGINLLELTKLRVGNFLPALLVVVLVVNLFPIWTLKF